MWSPSSSKSKWSSIPSSSWSTVSGHENIDVTSTILIIKLYMIAPTCPGLTAEQQSYEQADIIHGHEPPQLYYCLRKLGHSASISNNVTLQFKLGCHWPSLREGVQRFTWLLNFAFLWFRWQLTSCASCCRHWDWVATILQKLQTSQEWNFMFSLFSLVSIKIIILNGK